MFKFFIRQCNLFKRTALRAECSHEIFCRDFIKTGKGMAGFPAPLSGCKVNRYKPGVLRLYSAAEINPWYRPIQ